MLPPKFGKGIFQIMKAFEFFLSYIVLVCVGVTQFQIHALVDPDPDSGKEIEVDPDLKQVSTWIRILQNVVLHAVTFP